MTARFRILRFVALAAIALSGSQCALVVAQFDAGSPDRREVVYTPEDWPVPVEADLYPAARGQGPAPAVVLIHGGSWKGPDQRWQMRKIARELARRGYFVMNVTYRTTPDWVYPAAIDDIGEALGWIERNAEREGIDPRKIALFGYSAGGHLAFLSGLGEPRVKAIVAGAAPADLMLFEGGTKVRAFIGGTRREMPARYRAASPVHQVATTSPPVFLYHGTSDELVPAIHSTMMKAALDEAGVRNELYWLDGKGHVGTFLLGDPAVERAIDFLDRELKR